MKENKQFEIFGSLTKTETVFSVDQKIQQGTLVFEALKPFPGYYHETPMGVEPVYLYLALEKQFTLEEILRASQKVQLNFKSQFEAGKGFLETRSGEYNVLRIRHLENYNLLESLQKEFTENGIRFLNKSKKYSDEPAKIRIIKFFSVEEIAENIFLDKREENHAYIKIPFDLTWSEFESLTQKVKYNWVGSKFDAAKGAFYHEGTLHEVVRIYSDKIGLTYLQDLRNLYIEKMKL